MIFKIAVRNTMRQKRRTILTALTMFGGFVLASISVGWSDGTYSYIIDMFTRNQLGHIQIHGAGYLDKPSIYNTIEDYREVGKDITNIKGVDTWTPRLFAAGLASVEEKSAAAQIRGIDPQKENKATRFDKKIIEGTTFADTASHDAVLGSGLAKVLNAEPGDTVVIVSQAADGSIANDMYDIVGILESGDQMSDRMSLYLRLNDAQELFVLGDQIHEIAIVIDNLDEVDDLTVSIEKQLNNPELAVSPWQEFARAFYNAMRADVQGMWIMIFVIVLIVAIGVLNTVLMSVLERTKEYGVQRAIGTRPKQIFWQVIWEVNIIASVSIVIGIILSVLANHWLSIHGITLPQSFTYGGIEFKYMYAEVSARSLYIPAITVIISALLVSIFPALRAARIKPAKAMRIH
ncbi:MAG: FtsX-like permease family protein [candidate division KSB1 bacterium]|jgi:ABC-type lipoprotein release transport system permease subunit|nr:FtsX-like permease family protein [candidate division KSB1 bacterium]